MKNKGMCNHRVMGVYGEEVTCKVKSVVEEEKGAEGCVSSSVTLHLLSTVLAVQRGCKSSLTSQHATCFTCFLSWVALAVRGVLYNLTTPWSLPGVLDVSWWVCAAQALQRCHGALPMAHFHSCCTLLGAVQGLPHWRIWWQLLSTILWSLLHYKEQ